MPRHDFSVLSDHDLEELTRDLLQAEWKVTLEAFKAGRDSGIDLRYSKARGGNVIVQCKHFLASGFSKLSRHLHKSELPKVRKLQPKRYVLVTTVGLTPENKDALVHVLSPFVMSPADVIGRDDLEGLLSRHEGVRRAHYKLWLGSTDAIERIVDNAEITHATFVVDRVRRNLPRFVQSAAVARADAILQSQRTVVVSGPPGIGKTTLAEFLLLAHLEKGYEPIVVQGDVAEARKRFQHHRKQIVYYDDFLGQIFLGDRPEYFGRNQDVALVDFAELVRESPHGRLILTTRQHILNASLQLSERLRQSALVDSRCTLELRDYSVRQRAEILYNHLYFSDLPQEYLEQLMANDHYLSVVRHRHYSPRLMEWISAFRRVRHVAPAQYPALVTALLESPTEIWAHSFSKQLSENARELLYCFFSHGEAVSVADLAVSFEQLHQTLRPTGAATTAEGGCLEALRELDGAFLTYERGTANALNPSVRDFLAGAMGTNSRVCLGIISTATHFRQLISIWRLVAPQAQSSGARVLRGMEGPLLEAVKRLKDVPHIEWRKTKKGNAIGRMVDTSPEVRFGFIVEMGELFQSIEFLDVAGTMNALAGARGNLATQVTALATLNNHQWSLRNGGDQIWTRLLENVLSNVRLATASDWVALAPIVHGERLTETQKSCLSEGISAYCADGIGDERSNCSSRGDMVALRDSLAEMAVAYQKNLDVDIATIDEAIAEDDADDERPEQLWPGRPPKGAASDADIRNIFTTLLKREI